MEENIDLDRGDQEIHRAEREADEQIIVADLTAACNSLGKLDENDGTYMKDRDCKACLKEIVRLLNADTRNHIVRRTLGALNIVRTDLIPLINQYCDFNDGDSDLFNLVIRICTNLTSSVLLLFEHQEIPTDPDQIKIYNKLLSGLYGYKEAFANDAKVWKMLNTHMWHTEDEIPFERLLILLRNILHIPVDSSADLGMHSEFDTHSLCLYRMESSGMFHNIIKIAAETQRGSEFCFHVIEIVHLMLRDQNATTVAKSRANNNKRKLDDDDQDRKRLAELSAKSKRDQQVGPAKFAPPRFKNSLFVVKNCQVVGHNNLLTNRLLKRAEDISFDAGKTELRKAKNRKPLSSENSSAVISDRNTKPSQLTHKLKIFSKLFVERVYANYMQQIKHNLIQKKAAENDESYYLWAIQYFTAFNRLLYLSMDNVSETLSTSTLHFIQILITDYMDKIKIEKKRSQIERISKRLHLALRAYREILYLVKSVERESEFWDTIEKIKKNIFTELEYNSLLLTLFQQYDDSKSCPEYLKDLISTNDVFLDLLDDYTVATIQKHTDMTRYCSPDVIKAYLEVLRDFKQNDDSLNLQILKFYKRIVYESKCEVMLMQASMFSCLLEIAEYHSSMPGRDEFIALATHLMTIFGEMMSKKRWMIQELLFWKSHNDVLEIENAVDPPKAPATPVAQSPSAAEAENEALRDTQTQGEGDFRSQTQADSLDQLMAELGSDSSPDVSDADEGDKLPSTRAAGNGTQHDDFARNSPALDSLDDLLADLNDDIPMESDSLRDERPKDDDEEEKEDQQERVGHDTMEFGADDNREESRANDEEEDEDEIVASLPQTSSSSARRARLISSSEESEASGSEDESSVAGKNVRPAHSSLLSDSDDLSEPPSPVPTPSPDLAEPLSDLPAASEEVE